MNMENLLIPRYRVEQDYPDSDFEVGMIITFGGKSSAYTGVQEWETVPIRGKNGGTSMRCIKYFEPFPNIFRPLRWWEFRDESEMPLYVKAYDNEFYKVDCWGRMGYNPERTIAVVDNNMKINAIDLTPATEQQYLTYKNSK